jgi:hypothetical protein
MSEVEQRMERLPNDRTVRVAAAASRGNGPGGARDSKVRRNAWLLAGVAMLVYVGYIAWMFVRSAGG